MIIYFRLEAELNSTELDDGNLVAYDCNHNEFTDGDIIKIVTKFGNEWLGNNTGSFECKGEYSNL